MKQIIIILFVSIFSTISAYSQNKEALAKSDSLFALGVDLYNAGKYEEAIPIFTESDKIDKAELDSTSNRRDYSAMWLASCYYKLGNEEEAKSLNEYYMAEPVDRRLTVVSDSLSAIGEINYFNGNFVEALSYFLQCNEIEKTVVGVENFWTAGTLYKIALCYGELANHSVAISFLTRALEIIEKTLGKNHPDYILIINSVTVCNAMQGNYAEAIRLGTETVEIQERVWGKETPDYVISLSNLAYYYSISGNDTEAIHLETEALQIRERLYGHYHPDYVFSLHVLSLYNTNLGHYAEAIRLETEVLKIQEKMLGKDSSDYITCMNNLADYNSKSGNYTEAIKIVTDALKICERVFGKESAEYASSLNLLANYKSEVGNYSEAIRLETDVLSIRLNSIGKDNPDYAISLSNLAIFNSQQGNYSEAIRLGNDALEIQQKISGKDNPNYALFLNNLALINSYLGNYTEAVRLETEALEIHERVLGKNRPEYATYLNNLVNYNIYQGNYTEAIRFEIEALEIQDKILGKDHPYYARSLNNLSFCNTQLGNYTEAIRLITGALKICKRVFGKEHPDYIRYMGNLACNNFYIGNYSKAIRLEKEALEILDKISGIDNTYYAMSLSIMALYNFYDGQNRVSGDYSIKATQVYEKIIHSTFADLTANERTLFWNQYSGWYQKIMPFFAFYIQNDSLMSTVYDGTLLSKGLLLNSEIEMSKLLQESGDTAVVAKYEELKSNRALFNKMIENCYADLQTITDTVARAEFKAGLDVKIDSLERRLQMRERELVLESKVYGDYTRNLSVGWKQVQEKLGDNDVAIEFLNFGVRNDSIMYIAMTLTKGDDVPHMIKLFEKTELSGISKSDYYNTNDLSNLIWKPLQSIIEDKENIYFAPAGELHNIAIESIPCYDGDGLMSDHWNMYRLSSTRELALIKDKNKIKDAYLYGNLKYDMDVNELEENDKKYGNKKRSVDWETFNIADSLDLRGSVQQVLTPLPATKEEVESIDKSLKSQNVNSALLTETTGTESSFKALTGQRPSVLHIATHGFYWSESEAKKFNLSSMAMLNDNSNNKYVEDKALTRSGLFFAGAANAFRKDTKIPDGVDDGILTAKEISVLDLRGLDLVVLSACETGLGEITGDGVFGLQRGFKKAGANTLLMSLWKVDDTATQMLMSEFYSNLAKGENKFEALKEAQQYVRTTDNGKYSDPKFWAAFILLDAVD